jgi:hypothetical protein
MDGFKPRTELGKRLLTLRKKILASRKGLSSWDEVEREVSDRRGAAPAR